VPQCLTAASFKTLSVAPFGSSSQPGPSCRTVAEALRLRIIPWHGRSPATVPASNSRVQARSGSAGSDVWGPPRLTSWVCILPLSYGGAIRPTGASNCPVHANTRSASQCAVGPRGLTLERRQTAALPMAVGVEHRAKKVNPRLDHALLLQPVSNAMSFDPLTQPSGDSFPVPETPTVQGVEGQSEYNVALSGHPVDPSVQRQANKKRRQSKDKTSSALRRSSSTPHMRNLALGTAGDLSPTGDKRRNKLGYHRTSVACGEQTMDVVVWRTR
jgi:hypothetical protein